MTSAGKCVIRNNYFLHHSPAAALLVADDAASWYESGAVTDLRIEGNTFEGCRNAAMAFRPENTVPGTVHKGIVIRRNRFGRQG